MIHIFFYCVDYFPGRLFHNWFPQYGGLQLLLFRSYLHNLWCYWNSSIHTQTNWNERLSCRVVRRRNGPLGNTITNPLKIFRSWYKQAKNKKKINKTSPWNLSSLVWVGEKILLPLLAPNKWIERICSASDGKTGRINEHSDYYS